MLCDCIFVCFATTLSVITAVENSVNCGTNLFDCGDGQCISLDNLCDGRADCSNSSDETHPLCIRISAPNSGACVLPPYPENGSYEIEDSPEARPGQTRDFFEQTVSCRRGYGLDPYTGSTTQQVYCINGKWRQEMPKCVRFCRLDPDPSVRYMCYIPGVGVEACKNYLPPGTTVDPVCNSPIYYSTEVLPNMRCVSGFWNYVALCKAECGRITPGAKQLVVDGRQVKRGELPWHVGIYRKTADDYLQICGGSLVTNNLVISAAHCFWRSTKKLLPSSEFSVAAGKLYRSWNSQEDIDAQKSDVKEIRIPSLFAGEAANFQEDIAILILTSPFMYTTYIRPVCLDFGVYFDMLQLQDGKLGKVAGWGLTSANGKASETLMVVEMPFINDVKCTNNLPATFREYITGDKFCAGHSNGTALCQGDSGGGLAFSDNERGIERFYLRGVVSTAPNGDDKLCNDKTYIAFTKITKHQDLIKGALAASDKKICPLYSFQCSDGSCVDLGSDCNGRQDCADGSDESDEFCLAGTPASNILSQNRLQHAPLKEPGINKWGTETISAESKNDCGVFSGGSDKFLANKYQYTKGDMPWLAAVYTKTSDDVSFICGGTLISDSHVITVVHLLHGINNTIVKLGADNLNNMTNETVVRTVIYTSVYFEMVANTFMNGISILKLDKPVDFNRYIKPACLWNGNTDLNSIVGTSGVFLGWGDSVPQLLQMPIVSMDTCRAYNRPYDYLSSDKILCAGERDSYLPNLTAVHTGGGLYLHVGGKWRLRGILIATLQYKIPNKNQPRSHMDYAVFIDTAQYLPRIREMLDYIPTVKKFN